MIADLFVWYAKYVLMAIAFVEFVFLAWIVWHVQRGLWECRKALKRGL